MNQISPIEASLGSSRSRYPGTRPFSDSPEDQARFFGRDKQAEELYLRVLSVPLLVQFATSGLGKTSLLQAALFPRLRRKPFLPVMVRLDATGEGFTEAVARSFEQACKGESLKFPELQKDGLWELLSTAIVWRGDLLLTPVLVFDQFEEVFTLRDRAFRESLSQELGTLATGLRPERLGSQNDESSRFKARPDVKIVISLREDYLGALEEFSSAIPNLFHERLRLGPLGRDAAREAIVKPAELVAKAGEELFSTPPFEFEDSALDRMIEYLEGKSEVIEPFALQLLSGHAERIARAEAKKTEGPIRLTLADFNDGKDFGQVLKNFYQDALKKVEEKWGAAERAKVEELCEHGLLDRDGRRLLLEEGQIRDDFEASAEALATLGQERLIRREPRLESTFYEISHDRLAESIYASRRNKLPQRELDQRQREQEQLKREQELRRKEQAQLQEEQKLRKEQQRLIGKLQKNVVRISALCGVLALVLGIAIYSYLDALASRRLASEESDVAQRQTQEAKRQWNAAQAAAQDADEQRRIADRGRAAAERAEAHATAQKTAAEAARQQAEGMLGFMLGESFLGEIREMGRTSTLEKVRKFSQGPGDVSAWGPTLVYGLALRNTGDTERNKGDLAASLRYFQHALDVIEASPDTPDKKREVARTHDRLADASDESGEIGIALLHYQAEVGAWRDLLNAASPDKSATSEDCTALAEALESSGYVENQMGDTAPGLKDLNEALEIVSDLLIGSQSPTHPACRLPGEKIEAYPNARALMVLSEIELARSYNIRNEAQTAWSLAKTAKELMPPSISARRVASAALADKGTGETGLAALDDYRKAVAEFAALQAMDPDNKLLMRERAASELLMGQAIANCYSGRAGACACPADKTKNCESTPSLLDAEAMTLDAVGTVRALAQSDPVNRSWKSDLAWALSVYAKELAPQGQLRRTERLKAIDESEGIYLQLERDDNPETVERAASILEDEAEALTELHPDRSKAAMQGAVDRWRKLFAAHQSNAAYSTSLSDGLGRQQSLLKTLHDTVGAATANKEQLAIKTPKSDVQEAEDRLAGEYLRISSNGKKYLKEEKYDSALAEFSIAERKLIEYMNYSMISSSTYEALSSTYASMAEAEKALGDETAQAAALGASMHAAEVAAALDPAKMPSLVAARLRLLRFYFDRNRINDPILSTARQMVAETDRWARQGGPNAYNLWELANANFALGDILRAHTKHVGWEETIRSGIVDDEMAAVIDKKNASYPKEAGEWREKIAEYIEEGSPNGANMATHERQLALKDYQEADKRKPADEDIRQAIRGLAQKGVR